MHNKLYIPAIIEEATWIMRIARDTEAKDKASDFKWFEKELPMMMIKKSVPKVPGMDTRNFDKMEY